MVLVNSLGTRISYPLLEHSEWNGCSLADLVFPSFLFIVGMTTEISLRKHKLINNKVSLYSNIFKRTVLLFGFGLLINAFPTHFNLETLRVYGILQRIAICYFICSIIYLHTRVKTQILIYLVILLGYWYLLTQIPIPGLIHYELSADHNWVNYIDRMLFSPVHLLNNTDPEGLLGTLPAVATTLAGLITGSFLLVSTNKTIKCSSMILMGLAFLLVAWMWNDSFPMNKKLWTSTFVLWTNGISLIIFGGLYFVIDIKRYTKWSLPFKIFGMNALFIFIFHAILLKIQFMYLVTLPDGTQDNLRVALAQYLFGYFSPQNAGLFYAIVFLLFNFLVATFLYWKKIFIKI